MSITKHSYGNSDYKDDRVPSVFNSFFSQYKTPEKVEKKIENNLVKVASGCIDCPLYGKSSSTACNSCKFASGISYDNGNQFIKCSYSKDGTMKKEASSVVGLHWDNSKLMTVENVMSIKDEIKNNVIEELKYAAQKVGIKLSQEHMDDFNKEASDVSGKNLERAARNYVKKLQEKISLPTRNKISGSLDETFEHINKNSKTILASVSSSDRDDVGCGYLGSKVNPNSIWEPDAIVKSSKVEGNDEKIKKAKSDREEEKQNFKDEYWKILHEKLSSKDMISSKRVHSLSTEAKSDFNANLPANSMSIFSNVRDFENIPEKTAGETIAEKSEERSNKKSEENSEVQIKAAKTTESDFWLFKKTAQVGPEAYEKHEGFPWDGSYIQKSQYVENLMLERMKSHEDRNTAAEIVAEFLIKHDGLSKEQADNWVDSAMEGITDWTGKYPDPVFEKDPNFNFKNRRPDLFKG